MGIVSKIYGQGENMCKTEKNLIWLNCFFIASLLMANVVAGKVVSIGYFIVPAAVVAYPITFLCTDIIGEIWGENEANNTVKRGFLIQIFAMILLYIAILLPSAPFAKAFQLQFEAVLSNSARFVFASLCAVYLSDRIADTKVEIQIRTVAMDFWASLEHKIHYKFEGNAPEHIKEQLVECAQMVSALDARMMSLNEEIQHIEQESEE